MTIKVGFIGLGIMGKPMSKNLLKAGYSLVVSDRNPEAIADVIAAGAETATTPKAIAEQCDVIITMLPNSPHVKEVALGENGIIEGAKPGTVVIDMSSIAPLASREISEALKAKGIDMLDAPVSGGEQSDRRHPVGNGRRRQGDLRQILRADESDGWLRGAYRRHRRGQRHQTG